MQNLAEFASSDPENILSQYAFDSNDANYNLEFTVDPAQTKLFGPLGSDAKIYAENNITYNHHHDGVEPDKFNADNGLSSLFQITSVSYDNKGKVFVASMESPNYPFYGV